MAEAAKFAAFDKLKAQGQTSDLPGTYESLTQDKGGWRSWLYDHDLYFRAQDLSTLTYDVNGGKSPKSPQSFNGQKLTFSNVFVARLAWKVAGSGEDIGQFNASTQITRATWRSLGPTYTGIDRLDYYQSFFNRKLEVTVGIGSNIVNYLGIFSGGNVLLANGLGATIPVEVGLSGGPAVAPLLNVQINGKNGFYSKSGLQRSLRTEGATVEALTNHGGFKLTQPGAKALFIEEVGILRPASTEGRQMWLRAGGIYNTTQYTRFDGRGTDKNWAFYALADYQIIKPDAQRPYRGVFIGASALIAPGAVNVYKQTYEARAYAVGMIPGRDTDALNLTVSYNRFSKDAQNTYNLLGLQTQHDQLSVGLLYAAHVTRGIFLTPSVTYIRNPSFTNDYKPAVNASATVAFLL